MLVDDEFRRFCPACVQLLRQPAETTGGDAVKLLKATGRVLQQIGWLAVGVELVFALPGALASAFGLPSWVASISSFVLGTFAEVLVLGTWTRRHLQGQSAAPLQWQLAAQAFFRAIAVNVLTSLLTTVGMLLCCVGLLIGGPLAAAIPIALLERKGPIDAVTASWERSQGQRVALGVAYLVLTIPMIVFSSIPGALVGFSVGTGRPLAHLDGISAALVLVAALANTLPRLFQLVAWLSTRPLPAMPTGAPAAASGVDPSAPPAG